MKRYFIFLLLTGLFTNSFSQTEFREGYVILQNGDTLYGYVNTAKKTVCHFKKNESEKKYLSYDPGEIVGFGVVNGRYYESKVIPERNETEPDEIVFMECLVKGAASLYSFNNRFFSLVSDTSFYELSQTTNKTTSPQSSGSFVQKRYYGILNYQMKGCPDVGRKLIKLKLSKDDLVDLFSEYNICVSSPYIYFLEKKPKLIAKLSIHGGLTQSSINLKFSDKILYNSPINASSGMAGASLNLTWPRATERISMNLGLMYFFTNFHISGLGESGSRVDYVEGMININELKVPLGLQYSFNTRRLTPFVGAGFAGNMSIGCSTEFSHEVQISGVVTTDYFDLFQPDRFYFNFWSGIGVKYDLKKDVEGLLELRYDLPTNIASQYDYFKASISHISLVLGIRYKLISK
jgi:hypothetical protein